MKTQSKLPDKLPVRIIVLLVGLCLIALGVAISAKSDLGVSPSSTIPYVVSRAVPESLSGIFSMGNLTIALHCIYVLVQIALLKKNYKPIQLCQIALAIAFGKFIDLWMYLAKDITVSNYIVKLVLCIVACIVMGMGVFLEVKANLFTMPAEGAISTIAAKLKGDFGKFKIGWDFGEIAISVILSFIFFGTLIGAREGTIIAAFLVGFVVSFCNKKFAFVNRLLNGEEKVTEETVASKYAPLVVTIEREFGTGGHEIGEKLAAKLGVPLYDQAIIARTADAAGVGIEEVKEQEEKLPLGLISFLYNNNYAASHNISQQDEIFKAQSQVVKDIAAKESCVIVGRLGAYNLKYRPNTFNIFVSADSNYRADRISEKYKINFKRAKELIKKEDVARANYCQHVTGEPWGLACHYNLGIDSSMYDIDASVDLIMQALDIKEKNTERLEKLHQRRVSEKSGAVQ